MTLYSVVELKVDALNRSMELVKEHPADDYTAELMFKLANELYREADIDMDKYADVLRLYADWLQDTSGYSPERKHGV